MKQYLDLLSDIKENGILKADRTGTGTYSCFGKQIRFDLPEGFPLLTTKKMFTRGIIVELLWFLKGDTNIKYLQDNNVHIWDEWADENGDLGPVYGKQWREWETNEKVSTSFSFNPNNNYVAESPVFVDQIKQLINNIKTDPFSRRLIVSAWNVADIPKMKLAPCHCLFQFNIRPDKEGNPEYLDCQLYQRSADVFLGVPFNIASYALLTMMIANVTGLKAGEFIHSFGDTHIYTNHVDQVQTQLSREPLGLPTMQINKDVKDIFSYEPSDFTLVGYEHHAAIKAPIAI